MSTLTPSSRRCRYRSVERWFCNIAMYVVRRSRKHVGLDDGRRTQAQHVGSEILLIVARIPQIDTLNVYYAMPDILHHFRSSSLTQVHRLNTGYLIIGTGIHRGSSRLLQPTYFIYGSLHCVAKTPIRSTLTSDRELGVPYVRHTSFCRV